MGLREYVYHFAGERFFDRPGESQSLAEHAEGLRSSGEAIQARLAPVSAGERHREVLRHVVGIERWGQRRLRVLLGEPFVDDGHQPYKPPSEAPWDALLDEFRATREETVRLAGALAAAGPEGKVRHNDFGEMGAGGWLRYLRRHADMETKRVR